MAKILVVDSNGGLADEYLTALEDVGYSATLVTSREAVLSVFSGRESSDLYDLVLMNFVLKHESTVELVRDIRRGHRERRVLVLHSILTPDALVKFMKAGAYDVVDKPLNPKEIVGVVRKYFVED